MLRDGEQVSVRLTGGGPYGLRICATGSGPQHQLIVAKLHRKSKARAAGVRVGDVVLSINGNRCQRMSQETANNIIDYSNDLTIQLLRGSDDDLIHHSLTSSFRHSPQPPSSLTPSPAPYHPGSEPATIEFSTATELFRHPRHPPESGSTQRSGQSRNLGERPTVKVTRHWNEESLPQQPKKSVRWSGEELEPRADDAASGKGPGTEQTDGMDGREDGFGWRRWIPPASAGTDGVGDILEDKDSSLQQPKASSTLAQSQPLPSFQPSQALPSKSKPLRWQPPSAIDQTDSSEAPEVESKTLGRNAITRPLDSLVHEVVIWSSKSAEVEHGDGAEQKPLPWQQPQQPGRKTYAPVSEDVTSSLASRQKPNQWQPRLQKSGNLEGQEFGIAQKLPTWQSSQPTVNMATEKTPTWQPSQPTVTMATEKTPTWQPSQPTAPMATEKTPTWQLSQPTVPMATEKTPTWQPSQPTVSVATEKTPSLQPTPTQPVDVSTSERSQPRQHRWQPTQPPHGSQYLETDQSARQPNTLEEPRRSQQDGSVSPVVTTLFLTRVVTDGSAIVAGSGSDAETTVESVTSGKRKLYGDSSFYEDPEHKYPTIEQQIKMARKVALLLTSPANKNARGQRMFLKRKEQSAKWVIDALNRKVPYLFVSPPHPPHLHSSQEEVDHSKILSQTDVERMRYYEEKSRHDVIPFDVCSMLAAELHEEKGRGGRLFAKRREKADMSITPESNGLIRVPSPRPEQKPKFVPGPVAPIAAPVVRAERDELDGAQPSVSVPVNRLKDMVDLPKARITPWDSAVQYGTVEPAFEHLKDYRLAVEPTPAVAGPLRVFEQGGGVQGTFRQGQGQGRDRGQGRTSNQSYGFKRDKHVEDRTEQYQSTFSEPPPKITGVAGFDGSSGFIRQASSNRKGYRQVHFEAGTRSFN